MQNQKTNNAIRNEVNAIGKDKPNDCLIYPTGGRHYKILPIHTINPSWDEIVGRVNQLTEQYHHEVALNIIGKILDIFEENSNIISLKIASLFTQFPETKFKDSILSKAKKLVIRALQLNEKIYGKDSLELLELINLASRFHKVYSEHNIAIQYGNRNLEILQSNFGSDHIRTVRALFDLVKIQKGANHYAGAESDLLKCLPIIINEYGEVSFVTAFLLKEIGFFYYDGGETKKAKSYFARTLKIRKLVGDSGKSFDSEKMAILVNHFESAVINKDNNLTNLVKNDFKIMRQIVKDKKI